MTRSRFDEKRIRNLVEMTETPAGKLARQLENSPVLQITRMLERYDLNSSIPSVRQASLAFEAHAKLPLWAELSAKIEAAHRPFARPETFGALQRLDQNLRKLALAPNPVVLPAAEALQAFSASAAGAIHPLHSHLAELDDWRSSIAQRMATLAAPWAMKDHLGVSVVGFSRIARLHDLSMGAEPFAPPTAEIFDEELGQPVPFALDVEPEDRESAAMDAGLNPEVIAFPPSTYPRVLFSAGFEFSIDAVGDVQSDSGDETGMFDSQHATLLHQIEHRLRMAVETELRGLAGERWYRSRVPGSIWKRWQERKGEDCQRRGDSFRLIFYADFRDLSEIICRKDNWNDAFHTLFRSKADLQVSLQRLSPIRNAIAHNRPLVRTDQITLVCEACRILTALGVRF